MYNYASSICQDSTSCGHSSRFVCLYVRTVCQVGVRVLQHFLFLSLLQQCKDM